jgi:predicted esterase
MKTWGICLVISVVSVLAVTPTVAQQSVLPTKPVEMPLIVGPNDASSGVLVENSATLTQSGELTEIPEEPAATKKLIESLPYIKTKSPEKLTLEQLETIAKLPPRSNKAGIVVHPAMVPLFRHMVLRYTGGDYKNSPIHFRLHTPTSFKKGKKYPMVVWLHGVGECGDDNINQIGHLHHIITSLVGRKKRDFFLLVPQCPHTHSSWEAPRICETTVRADGSVECHTTEDQIALGNAPISYTLAMIDAVVKKYPIDTNRITVSGLSSGGAGTWKILERRPDLFAAAVPIVSWEAMSEKSLRNHPILKKIPIWSIYSSDDRGIDFARKEFQRMQDAGCRVFKTEFGVCGHRAWTPAMLQGDVFGWLLSRAKDGDRFYAAEPSPTDPEKIGTFADVTGADDDLMRRRFRKQPTRAPKEPKEPKEPQKVKPSEELAALHAEIERTTRAIQALQSQLAQLKNRRAKLAPKEGGNISSGYVVVNPPVDEPFLRIGPLDRIEIEKIRLDLIRRYIKAKKVKEALAVADKIGNRRMIIAFLIDLSETEHPFRGVYYTELLDYIDKELDRMENETAITCYPSPPDAVLPRIVTPPASTRPTRAENPPLEPIPVGKKDPMDECGKEWAMSTTTLYGMFPNGWDKESKNVPDYVINESGKKIFLRIIKAFNTNDLKTMEEICNSFIKLDDIPLSSPWFNTSGGRLQSRIKYTLNKKSKLVVEILKQIAQVKEPSRKEFATLAQKALDRIEKITNPKTD